MKSSRFASPVGQSFVQLAVSCCRVEAAVIVEPQGDAFVVSAAEGLRGSVADLRGDKIFAGTLAREGILEVVGRKRPSTGERERREYRFFAGIAVRRPDGAPLGLLAVLDPYARMLEPRAREQLELLARGLGLSETATVGPGRLEIEDALARSPDPAIIYRPGRKGRFEPTSANRACIKLFGLDANGLSASLDTTHGERSDREVLAGMATARAARRPMRATLALYPRVDGAVGSLRWFEVSGYPVRVADGAAWVESYHDVTERVERITELGADRNRLRGMFASMDDAVVTADRDGRLVLMNKAARGLLDLRVPPGRGGHLDQRALRLRDIESEELLASPLQHVRRNGKAVRERALVVTQEGMRRYIEYAVAPISRPDRGEDGYVVVMRDVTEEEGLTRRLSFEASHDQLTGISNRRYFEQSLARALASAKSDASVQHTLAFLDLDRFKSINDSCGHAAGDEVLREIASLFKAQLRSHDVIARFGGDEFAILMHDCTTKTAARVMQRIRSAMSAYEWLWQTRSYTLGVSIGLAEIIASTPSAETALHEADAACYADKLAHRSTERRLAVLRGELGHPQRDIPWLR